MNLVDSSGWLEYFGQGPNAKAFAAVIGSTGTLLVPTLVLFEVFKRICVLRGPDPAFAAVAVLEQAQIVDLDRATALEAARLSIEHRLPMADSVILATARRHRATLWTQDADFAGIDGVRYVPATPRNETPGIQDRPHAGRSGPRGRVRSPGRRVSG